jgi:hypothetical protein
MMLSSIFTGVFLLSTIAVPRDLLFAQRGTTASDTLGPIPRELAIAMLGGPATGSPRGPNIMVGSAPPEVPSELLPANGFEILGSVTYTGPGSAGRYTVIGTTTSDTDSILSRLRASWEKAGFKVPGSMQSFGGFVPAESLRPDRSYCRDSVTLGASTSARPQGGSYLRIYLNTGQRTSCNAPPFPAQYTNPMETPLPSLLAPPGMRMNGGGSGGAAGRESSASLQTEMTPGQLLAHYASQMQAQGWTLG